MQARPDPRPPPTPGATRLDFARSATAHRRRPPARRRSRARSPHGPRASRAPCRAARAGRRSRLEAKKRAPPPRRPRVRGRRRRRARSPPPRSTPRAHGRSSAGRRPHATPWGLPSASAPPRRRPGRRRGRFDRWEAANSSWSFSLARPRRRVSRRGADERLSGFGQTVEKAGRERAGIGYRKIAVRCPFPADQLVNNAWRL